MSSGPSKQELEMYWQNSRQYFDELAKHYQKADPAYYKEFIEPFYTNPFRTQQTTYGRKSTGGGGKAVLAIAVFMVLLIGGIAAFIFIYAGSDSKTEKEIEKLFKQEETKSTDRNTDTEQPEVQEPVEPTDPGDLSSDDNFIIGSKYIGEKKYDKAEYHLKKVKPGSKYYEQSKQLLENMKYFRQYNK